MFQQEYARRANKHATHPMHQANTAWEMVPLSAVGQTRTLLTGSPRNACHVTKEVIHWMGQDQHAHSVQKTAKSPTAQYVNVT